MSVLLGWALRLARLQQKRLELCRDAARQTLAWKLKWKLLLFSLNSIVK